MSVTKTYSERGFSYIMPFIGAPLDSEHPENVPSQFSAGAPDTHTFDGTGFTATWDADWTPEQEAEHEGFAVRAERRQVPATPPDDPALQPHWEEMRTFWNNANPDGTETVRALKATIKVLREMSKE